MFSPNDYIDILQHLKENGFNFKLLLEDVSKGDICIRHDVDFSVEYALNTAINESQLNIKASYFFTLNSHFYNVLTPQSTNIINEIIKLGHKVSLHVDPTLFINREKSLDQEISFFSNYFSTDIDIISLHRPRGFLENNNELYHNRVHTYQDKFFKNMLYISDSAGNDIRSQIYKINNTDIKKPLQILIHPIWWQQKTDCPKETLDIWLNRKTSFLTQEIKDNCRAYSSKAH